MFPFIEIDEDETEEIEELLPLAREYAFDIKKEEFKYKNGKMYFVEGKEALKIWLWKLFKTNRFRELIYSWGYGSELESLIGQGYTQGYINSEAERYVKEAIEYNIGGYITNINNVDIDFNNAKLATSLSLETVYGEVEFVG